MTQPRTQRKFEQRFLDHTDRRIQQEARKRRFDVLKKRYATVALGASLALGGIGLPLRMARTPNQPGQPLPQTRTQSTTVADQLVNDLKTAQSIAREVSSGVQSAAETVTEPLSPLNVVEKDVTIIAEKVKEEFFKEEVPFGSIIYAEAKKNDLDPELVAAVVKTESRFKPNARSPVGAQGLMQLVPRTGRWMGAKNLMDPHQNIQAGTRYLKYLNERFDGNQTKVIAAYNAGEGNVRRFRGVPPFKETRNYLKKVNRSTEEYRDQIADRVAEAAPPSTDVAMR